MPASPSTDAPAGMCACFRLPAANLPGSKPFRSATSAVHAFDLVEDAVIHHQVNPCHAGDGLHRAIVMGRPQAAGRDDQVVAGDELPKALLDGVEAVTDGERPLHREAAQLEVARKVRRVQIGDDPAQKLVSREQHRCGRAGRRLAQPTVRPLLVTVIGVPAPAPAGSGVTLPLTEIVMLPGAPTVMTTGHLEVNATVASTAGSIM